MIFYKFIILLFFAINSFCCSEELCENFQKVPKILVLIIASDDRDFYIEDQKTWRSYMHLDQEHVKAYFIKADPDLEVDYKIVDDTIWSKTVENLSPGILNKTVLSLECLLPDLEEYDFVIRTNLSSFYIFPRLLNFLSGLPVKDCYCGVIGYHNGPFVSGAGIILSKDVAKMIVKYKSNLLNDTSNTPDDVVLGQFFQTIMIKAIPANRIDLLSMETWLVNKDRIPSDIFHLRIKASHDWLRISDEVYIQRELVRIFYPEAAV